MKSVLLCNISNHLVSVSLCHRCCQSKSKTLETIMWQHWMFFLENNFLNFLIIWKNNFPLCPGTTSHRTREHFTYKSVLKKKKKLFPLFIIPNQPLDNHKNSIFLSYFCLNLLNFVFVVFLLCCGNTDLKAERCSP